MAAGVLFHALIVPHRSLSRRGLYIVLAMVVGGVILTGLRFLIAGAWPVMPFSVVDCVLAAVLLLVNARRGRASELVVLTEDEITVTRTDAAGREVETKHLPNAWLNVVVEERAGSPCRLLLATHGVQEEIGAVLGDAKKRDLAKTMQGVLWRMRHPVFDNPQLREPGARDDAAAQPDSRSSDNGY